MTTERIRCSLCYVSVPSIEAAIDAEWEPSYFDDGGETGYPICPECAASKCTMTPEGPELKPLAIQPTAISEYGRYLPPVSLFSRGQ